MYITINGKPLKDKDGCPFFEYDYELYKWGAGCKITEGMCRWGITDVVPPKECPLRKKAIIVRLIRRNLKTHK